MKPPHTPPMTLARFTELLDAYGARAEAWPPESREAAQLLLQDNGDAQRLVAVAERLDTWLDDYAVAEVSPALQARVLEVPIIAARKQRRFGFRIAWAVALSCLIGVASGALTAPEASADDDEWVELTEVSFYADADSDADVTAVEEAP